ncbi:MAG TPA: cytochrome b [Caulobacteraceae bacterium]|nr:cytochrome b [Caulobacteraceae bacterium]
MAIVLHWTIAALILGNLYLGLSYANAHGLAKFNLLQLHKSIGFTVLGLSLLRLATRLLRRPPPYPDSMKPWEKLAASAVHWGFYVIMIGLPLTGWVIVSASPTNIPTLLFKTVPVPHLEFVHALPMVMRRALETQVSLVHDVLAWGTMALLVLHVGAAMKHQFWNKDGVLYRMAPFQRAGT